MRGLLQRVIKASVTVGGNLVSEIGKGVIVFLGITHHDTIDETTYMIRKILNTRLWEDANGKSWSKSVKDLNLEVLIVSQFTLYNILKGNRPDFHGAMETQKAKDYFNNFILAFKLEYDSDKIKTGSFGNYMNVHVVNDGPVTIMLEREHPRNIKDIESKS